MVKTSISIILFLFSIAAYSQATVTVDWANNNKPEVNYKRGPAAPGMNGFKDSPRTRQFLDIQASFGMTIHNGIRNLFKDPETNEFYQENGEFKNQQSADFTSIRQYAVSKGFELISQVGGTPRNSGYEFDSTYYKVLPFGPHTDFAPIPAEGKSMQEFQRNFAEWAINADKAVGENFHSIWIGTQEIAHTIGFPGGNANSTAANKNLNIRRFTDYWKPISDSLRKAGARTGALQLNWSNHNIYDYAVNYMIEQDLHVDFLTYQFYQFGDTLALVKAVAALELYNKVYPGTQIIIDRGASGKIMPPGVTYTSSEGTIYFLVGELGAMNHADKIYAITLDMAENSMEREQNNVFWQTRKWLNSMGTIRCNISDMPDGVGGFATRTDNKLSAVIWNRSIITQQLILKVSNATFGSGTQLTVKQARGEGFISSAAIWNDINNSIEGITLNPFDFVLIDLESPVSVRLNELPAEELTIYPNPVKDQLYIFDLDKKASVDIYNMQGKLLIRESDLSENHSINVSGLEKGVYIVKITDNKRITTISFVKL